MPEDHVQHGGTARGSAERAGASGHTPLRTVLARLAATESFAALRAATARGERVACSGSCGSSTAFVAGALALKASRPVLLVTAHLDDAEEAFAELTDAGIPCDRLPALEALPGESLIALDVFSQRLRVTRGVRSLIETAACVIVCPVQALMQLLPGPAAMERCTRTLRAGESVALQGPAGLAAWLASAGFLRVDEVEEPGQFALRGGILDIFPPNRQEDSGGEPVPVRLDFFGDTLERVAELDPATNTTDRALTHAEVLAVNIDAMLGKGAEVQFLDLVPTASLVVLAETMEIVEQARGYYERVTDAKGVVGPPAVLKVLEHRFAALAEINQFSAGAQLAQTRIELPIGPLASFDKDAGKAVEELVAMSGEPGTRVVVCCQNEGEEARLAELLEGSKAAQADGTHARGTIESIRAYVHRGFVLREDAHASLAVVPYHELLSRFGSKRSAKVLRHARAMDTFLDFQAGDYVVHAEHGIAHFVGLTLMSPRDLPIAQRPQMAPRAARTEEVEEFLTLEFANKSRLHVPAMQIDKVQKYVGGFAGKPPLSVMGGVKWKHQKERVTESVKDLAAELLRVRAAREHMPGQSFPNDTTWQHEFEAEFPFDETPDQLAAIQEIKRDMHAARPMDRLLCGDVGFGKTELAVRGAFKCAEFGKQVAVLAPTTVLAEQHERTFKGRFAGYPFRVESVSRFKTDGEIKAILAELRQGKVDVIIGTHRLLSKDVVFADLGLVIIDEEQRFGVEHKETLLRFRMTVDVLTLSATPIPRTLHMAMLGIRDISSLATPPPDRRAIVTEVIPFNEQRVRQAIARELSREGQVYYVHNRVHDITSVADNVQRFAPGARIVVGHGQMAPHELEEVMLTFMRREADILVSTTIIESGIDNPHANTMIIDDADRFGLSDLHQLRGRVGRSKHRAYCYLLLPLERTIKDTAKKRLKALEQYSMLGAGFKIAMRDLEIRGAGNILGSEQSGHIASVGYEMYCRLLETSVHELNNEPAPPPPSSTTVEIGVPGLISKAYIPSDNRRLAAYRRIAAAATGEELHKAREDLIDAYGAMPAGVETLFDLAQVRIALHGFGCRMVTIREKDVVFVVGDVEPLAKKLAMPLASGVKGLIQLHGSVRAIPAKPDKQGKVVGMGEVFFRPPESYLVEPVSLLTVLRKRLGLFEPTAGSSQRPPTAAAITPANTGNRPRAAPPSGVRSKPVR